MTERPIIFSGPMVRAILAGRKTQTRRIFTPQPVDNGGDITIKGHRGPADYLMRDIAPRFWARFAVGDVLWVKETWTHVGVGVWSIANARMAGRGGVRYKADRVIEVAGYWPSIHMPREFSRLSLKVTRVEVERLQEISEEDAVAEGCPGCMGSNPEFPDEWDPLPVEEYRDLWERIHGPGSWDANPWVVAISFEPTANPQRGTST